MLNIVSPFFTMYVPPAVPETGTAADEAGVCVTVGSTNTGSAGAAGAAYDTCGSFGGIGATLTSVTEPFTPPAAAAALFFFAQPMAPTPIVSTNARRTRFFMTASPDPSRIVYVFRAQTSRRPF